MATGDPQVQARFEDALHGFAARLRDKAASMEAELRIVLTEAIRNNPKIQAALQEEVDLILYGNPSVRHLRPVGGLVGTKPLKPRWEERRAAQAQERSPRRAARRAHSRKMKRG